MGAGGTGKGAAGALRRGGALKDLEKRQKSRHTRAVRDALDRALIDLAAYFRDALMIASGPVTSRPATRIWPTGPPRWPRTLRGPVVALCRGGAGLPEALAGNVKPKFAIDAMVATVGPGAAFARVE